MLILSNYSNTKLPTTSVHVIMGEKIVFSGYCQDFPFSFSLIFTKIKQKYPQHPTTTHNFTGKTFSENLSFASYCAERVVQSNLHMSSNNTE